MSRTRASFSSLAPVVVLLLLLALLPAVATSSRVLSLAITAGINIVALYGLSVLFGQIGILSLGHAALVGVGAYTAAIVSRDLGLGFWLAIPIAAVLSSGIAAIVGFPSLRVGGHHFVIMTFAFGQLLSIVLTNGGDFTGRATGLDLSAPTTLFGIDIGALPHFYLLTLGFVALSAIASWAIINSPYGRTLRAVRENEKLAASIGIDVGRQKIGAFAVSGAFAGVSGVLMAYFLRHIAPNQFSSFPSIYLALMVMIGGARLLLGPLAGGILVAFLPEMFNLDPVESRILYGLCLIAVIMLLPNGLIAGAIGGGKRLFCLRRAPVLRPTSAERLPASGN